MNDLMNWMTTFNMKLMYLHLKKRTYWQLQRRWFKDDDPICGRNISKDIEIYIIKYHRHVQTEKSKGNKSETDKKYQLVVVRCRHTAQGEETSGRGWRGVGLDNFSGGRRFAPVEDVGSRRDIDCNGNKQLLIRVSRMDEGTKRTIQKHLRQVGRVGWELVLIISDKAYL